MHTRALRLVLALSLPVLGVAWTGSARAEGQPGRWAETGTASFFLQGGWGIQVDAEDDPGFADAYQSVNAYAFGIDLRAGYTFPFKLYVGGRVAHHFGRDGWEHFAPGGGVSVSDGVNEIGPEGGNITESQSVTHFGPELGYDFVLGPLVLRPYMPLGLLLHRDQECFPGACESFNSNQFFLGIGASLFGSIGSFVFGVDSAFVAPLDDASLNGGLFSLIAGWQLPH